MEDDEIVIGINTTNNNFKKKKNNSKNKKKANSTKKRIESQNSNISKKTNSRTRISSSIKNSHNKYYRLKIFTAIFLVIILVIIILSSSIFDIKNINIINNNILSADEIISISGIEKYNNIFNFNRKKVINNIKTNAYVETAKIVRKLPSTVEIIVNERIPSFMMQYADSYVYINYQGYMLEVSNEKLNIPILVGFTTELENIKVGNRINNEDLKKMNTVVKIFEIAKSNDLSDLITKIDVTDTKNYTIVLEGEGKTVYLGDCNDSDLNTKMLYLKSIVDASPGRVGEVFLNGNLNSQYVYVRWSTE